MNPALAEIVRHPKVKHSELLTVLHSYFQHSSNPLPGGARRLGDQNQGCYLDVHFKKDGTISTIGAKLDDVGAKALAAHLRSSLLEHQKEAIGQALCFSLHNAVQGFYR